MVERDEEGRFVTIRCDKCGKGMPSLEDVIINEGLNRMGWKCSGGTHLCPDCKPHA